MSSEIKTAGSTIKFTDDLAAQQASGDLIALAAIFYRPETDMLEYYFPEAITEEEAVAVLRKFRCFPKSMGLPRG